MKMTAHWLVATVCVVGMLVVLVEADPSAKKKRMIAKTTASHGETERALQTATLIEDTGFEVIDGFEARDGQNNGFICGPEFASCTDPTYRVCPDPGGKCCKDDPNPDNGWYVDIGSMHCLEPHISMANPKTGDQHLRFQRASSNAEGHWGPDPDCIYLNDFCIVSAVSPSELGSIALDVGVTNTDMDIYSSDAFSSEFTIFEVTELGRSIFGVTLSSQRQEIFLPMKLRLVFIYSGLGRQAVISISILTMIRATMP